MVFGNPTKRDSVRKTRKSPCFELLLLLTIKVKIPYGLAARIPVFHPGGPGSTLGMGK